MGSVEKGKCLNRSRDNVVELAIEFLEAERNCHKIKALGQGTYGDVYLMYDPSKKDEIAAKIVTSENISEMELKFWPKLRHPNIVQVLELVTISSLDATVFIMPVQNGSLYELLSDRSFTRCWDALEKLKVVLYDVLLGLDYLHSNHLCHLDIKVDNILIAHEGKAIVCDFSFLNVTTDLLVRYELGLPYVYRPPEACFSKGPDITVEGKAYDMWGYGIMLVEIFSTFYLIDTISHCEHWMKDIYPVMFDVLQEDEFVNGVIQAFPRAEITESQAKLALNFTLSFLMSEPEKRILPKEAMQHPFLNNASGHGPTPDDIWIYKISETAVPLLTATCSSASNVSIDIDKEAPYSRDNPYSSSEDEEYVNFKDTDESKYLREIGIKACGARLADESKDNYFETAEVINRTSFEDGKKASRRRRIFTQWMRSGYLHLQ